MSVFNYLLKNRSISKIGANINREVKMFYNRSLLIISSSFALNFLVATSQNPLFDEALPVIDSQHVATTIHQTELNSAEIVAIGVAMVNCYKDFLTSRTVQLSKESLTFEFFAHKKGRKYKIPKNGCIDLLLLDRFISCLSEDIDNHEAAYAAVITLRQAHENNILTSKKYMEALSEYGVNDEFNIDQCLERAQKSVDKFKAVREDLRSLKAQEYEARVRDFTFENAFRYLPAELTTNSTILGLSEAYIRENFFPIA
jgi:hypothetical protein